MSKENVATLERVYERWATGEFRAGQELLSPDLTTVWAQDFPTAGTYHGPEGHAAAMREWLSAWTSFRLEPERFIDAGGSVVVPFTVRACGRDSGAEVERRWAHVWTFRDGRVVRLEVHLDVEQALEAVG